MDKMSISDALAVKLVEIVGDKLVKTSLTAKETIQVISDLHDRYTKLLEEYSIL